MSENGKPYEQFSSYDALLAEARRVLVSPKWAHIGLLCDVAHKMYDINASQFHNDLKPSISLATLARWKQMATKVYFKLPTRYREAANIAMCREVVMDKHFSESMSKDQLTKLFVQKMKHGPIAVRFLTYLSGLNNLSKMLEEEPDLLSELNDVQLARSWEAIQDLNEAVEERMQDYYDFDEEEGVWVERAS